MDVSDDGHPAPSTPKPFQPRTLLFSHLDPPAVPRKPPSAPAGPSEHPLALAWHG